MDEHAQPVLSSAPEGFTDSHGNHPALPHTLPKGPDLSRVAALTGSGRGKCLVVMDGSSHITQILTSRGLRGTCILFSWQVSSVEGSSANPSTEPACQGARHALDLCDCDQGLAKPVRRGTAGLRAAPGKSLNTLSRPPGPPACKYCSGFACPSGQHTGGFTLESRGGPGRGQSVGGTASRLGLESKMGRGPPAGGPLGKPGRHEGCRPRQSE